MNAKKTTSNKKMTSAAPKFDSVVCCLQGGGALGAYQVGVMQALSEAGYKPNWFVGTSIGAINAAICAGNQGKACIDKLMEFWDRVSRILPFEFLSSPDDLYMNKILNHYSSALSIIEGQHDFFRPRFPPPQMSLHDDPKLLSFYDTSPLKDTLEDLIDFDWLNSGKVRLSLGAVEITSGEIEYFDTQNTTIRAEHIMASGALPPGFPAVEVDGKIYWDGGISSNTPVSYVLNDKNAKDRLCFMIHLFDSYGMKPTSLDEVLKRKKDIVFSSRFRWILDLHREIHRLHYQIHYLSKTLQEEHLKLPGVKECARSGWEHRVALVRFLHKGDDAELSSKDYDFSKRNIQKNIINGYKRAQEAIEESVWNQCIPLTDGIALYEMEEEYLSEGKL